MYKALYAHYAVHYITAAFRVYLLFPPSVTRNKNTNEVGNKKDAKDLSDVQVEIKLCTFRMSHGNIYGIYTTCSTRVRNVFCHYRRYSAARKVRDYSCVSVYNSVKYTTLSVLSFGKYYDCFLYTILYVL